jgi:hypothetical protein
MLKGSAVTILARTTLSAVVSIQVISHVKGKPWYVASFGSPEDGVSIQVISHVKGKSAIATKLNILDSAIIEFPFK